jgi:hypothetical protein
MHASEDAVHPRSEITFRRAELRQSPSVLHRNHYLLLHIRVHASMEHRGNEGGGMVREHASAVEVVHYYIYSIVTRHLFLHSLNTHTRTSTSLQTLHQQHHQTHNSQWLSPTATVTPTVPHPSPTPEVVSASTWLVSLLLL